MAWIFGYGSLMWNPSFKYLLKVEGAILRGYHREFNKASKRNWGTPQNPCPTLGLEEGGECIGIAYEIDDLETKEILGHLCKREGRSTRFVLFDIIVNGQPIKAYVSVNKRDHHTYIGDLPLKSRVEMVTKAIGKNGRCADYIKDVVVNLKRIGIKDENAEKMAKLLD